jgi:hypothetical protein
MRLVRALPCAAIALTSSACSATVDDPFAATIAPERRDSPRHHDQIAADTQRLMRQVLPPRDAGGGDEAATPACPARQVCARFQHWDSEYCVCTPNPSCRPHQEALCPDGYTCIEDARGCEADDGKENCLGICVVP